MKSIVVGVCLLFALITPVFAGDEKAMNATLKFDTVTLFKNGLGFVTATATLPAGAAEVRIGRLPIPSFGTFWVSYPKGLAVRSLVTAMEESESAVPARSLAELLRLNPGRKVTVHLGDRTIEGTVIPDPSGQTAPEAASPYVMGARGALDPYGRPTGDFPSPSSLVVIKTAQGAVALETGAVTRVDFADGPVTRSSSVALKSPGIRLKLDKPAAGEKVVVTFLARGITWAPGYLVDLSDPAVAKFSAHAVVINEMADFKNAALELVTGFPNVKFGEVMSPVAKAQSLAEFIQALAAGGRGVASGMVTQQVMTNAAPAFDDYSGSSSPSYSTAAGGTAAEDLFFYPVADFTLNRDETAWLPLFTASMPYKHVYTWSIGDTLDRNNGYRPDGEGRTEPEEVWHSCRLTNTLSMPLTTAAAEFMTDGRFTGQDVCSYTPAGGQTTIRINKALNVAAEQAEVETDRKRDDAAIQGYRYDAVTLRGELRVKNKTGKTISVEIAKELSGEVLENAQKAKDVKTEKGLKQVNPKHLLTWEIELKSGEERVLTYKYKAFIRN